MANWRKELRELGRRDPDAGGESIRTTAAIYKDESDRGCALIAGSIAENALEEIIRVRLVHLNKQKLDELFGYEGVIGTFSAKIKIAYAFGIIDHKLRDDLDRIREIRNLFAHSKTVVTFKTPQVALACSGLMSGYPNSPIEAKLKYARMAYIDTTFAIIFAANLTLTRAKAGHTKKLKQTLSYDEIAALHDKSLRQFLQRTPPNRRAESKMKAVKRPPQSSRA